MIDPPTTTPLAPLLVDRRQAAELLGLSERTIDHLAASGELPRTRFGRATRFAVSDLEALIARQRETSAPTQEQEAAA